MWLGGAALSVAVLAQWWARRYFGSVLVGDEIDYIRRAARNDPFAPEPFLRVPLLIAICRLFGGNAARLMTLMGSVSALTAAGVTLVAYTQFGPLALIPIVLWLALPERTALAYRIWPEPILTACLAVVTATLLLEPSAAAIWLGASCAVASATRIDASLWAPSAALELYLFADPTSTELVVVVAPTVALLLVLTVINAVRYGIPLPDNTAFFNLIIMSRDSGRSSVPELVDGAIETWGPDSGPKTRTAATRSAVAQLARRLYRLPLGVARRALGLIGPETFVTSHIIGSGGRHTASDSARVAHRSMRTVGLRYGSTVLLATALACTLWIPATTLLYVLPAAVYFITSSCAHTRTRFRPPLLPAAVLLIAQGLDHASSNGNLWSVLLTAILASALAIVVTSAAARRETPT